MATKWFICDACEGNGKNSRHLGAFTESEFADFHPDEQDAYFAGTYDKPCRDCRGSGKVLSEVDSKGYAVIDEDSREMDDIERAEMAFGA